MNLSSSIALNCGGPGSGRHKRKGWDDATGHKPGEYKLIDNVLHMATVLMHKGETVLKWRQPTGSNRLSYGKSGYMLGDRLVQEIEKRNKEAVKAGGPGSGRHPGYAKGLNKWHTPEKEREAAHKDPKQRSLFDPQHDAKCYACGKALSPNTSHGHAITEDGQKQCVGNDCARKINQAETGYQPPRGGPRLYKIDSGEETVEREGIYPEMRSNNEGTEPPQTGAYSYKRTPKDKYFKVKADYDNFNGPVGGADHGHLEPIPSFHAPSNKKAKRVPTDDVRETDDKYLDVSKRNSKDTKEQRMKLLKRSAPGGLPPQIPVRTTLVSPHQAVYMPGIFGSGIKTRPIIPGRKRLVSKSYIR